MYIQSLKMDTGHPIQPATRCLLAGTGSILALLVIILNIGGLDLLQSIARSLLSTHEGWMIVLIPVIASLLGYFLSRLNSWLILITGVLVGLAGAWGIIIYAISQV